MFLTSDLSEVRDASRGAALSSVPARICVSSEIRDFAGLWPRSDRLGEARCYAFQCADIVDLQCRTMAVGRKAEPLLVAVIDRNDSPLVLLPLCLEVDFKFTRLFGKTRVLRFLDGGLSDYNAPVVFPPVRHWNVQTVRTVWKAIQSLLPAFDIAVLEKMPKEIGDLPNPLGLLNTSAFRVSGHAMTLSGTWRDFEAKLPRMRSLHSRGRRLNEQGTVKLELAETHEQYDSFIEVLLRKKSHRYLETRGVDGLERPGYRDYLRKAGEFLYPSGPVCLHALKVNDSVIATIFGLVVGDRFIYLMPSFDAEWRRYSPGRIAAHKAFEWCFSKGLKVFDFGIGDEPYKDEYCDILIGLNTAAIPSNGKGLVSLLWRNAIDRLREARRRVSLKRREPLVGKIVPFVKDCAKGGVSLARRKAETRGN